MNIEEKLAEQLSKDQLLRLHIAQRVLGAGLPTAEIERVEAIVLGREPSANPSVDGPPSPVD